MCSDAAGEGQGERELVQEQQGEPHEFGVGPQGQGHHAIEEVDEFAGRLSRMRVAAGLKGQRGPCGRDIPPRFLVRQIGALAEEISFPALKEAEQRTPGRCGQGQTCPRFQVQVQDVKGTVGRGAVHMGSQRGQAERNVGGARSGRKEKSGTQSRFLRSFHEEGLVL